MQLFETLTNVVSQGSVRRGFLSPYLPLEHPDIDEFLDIGTEGNPIQKLTHGVTVGNEWMQAMVDGDPEKRAIWAKVLQRRSEVGYPYILFVDNANDQAPQVYRDNNMKIYASNMCSEIMLPSKADESFVCCLSSLNVRHYDEWKDTDLVETMIAFLDAVITEFITKIEANQQSTDNEKQLAGLFMARALNFAKRHRAIGLGVLGWHSLLQEKMLPFESDEAMKLNVEIFKNIRAKADAETERLAIEFGEPEVLVGLNRRNTTTMAIAPTTSSAFILGQVSQGIEPIWSNCYIKDVAKLKVQIKNPQLEQVLEQRGLNTKEVWDSIRNNDGSVQHLDELSDLERDVFKTFAELDQSKIIEQAADRQVYIDQGQSLNIMVPPNVPVKELNTLHIQAWKTGVKSLYYQHSLNAAQQMVRRKIQGKGK
jgi:ribonucleoside-diphosphate reductase alpha chain